MRRLSARSVAARPAPRVSKPGLASRCAPASRGSSLPCRETPRAANEVGQCRLSGCGLDRSPGHSSQARKTHPAPVLYDWKPSSLLEVLSVSVSARLRGNSNKLRDKSTERGDNERQPACDLKRLNIHCKGLMAMERVGRRLAMNRSSRKPKPQPPPFAPRAAPPRPGAFFCSEEAVGSLVGSLSAALPLQRLIG
jgi:hypothetical protein